MDPNAFPYMLSSLRPLVFLILCSEICTVDMALLNKATGNQNGIDHF
jgi:hypothetical protein